MIRIFLILCITLLYSCVDNQEDTQYICNCNDLQLDPLYNHFFQEDRTIGYNGSCYIKDKSGHILEERNYKEGKVHGILTNYFLNGNKKMERTYVRNMQDGPVTQWDSTGNLLLEALYKRGELDTILVDNR